MATIVSRVVERLEFDQEGFDSYRRKSYRGHVTLDELRELMTHHSVRRISVSAGTFGLVDLDARKVRYWVNDPWRRETQKRLEEKTGRPVEASVTLELARDTKHPSWSLSIHDVCAFVDDERKNYYPFY